MNQLNQEPPINPPETEEELLKRLADIDENIKNATAALNQATGTKEQPVATGVVTPEMERRLLELGFTKLQINGYTPEKAQRIIKRHEGKPAKKQQSAQISPAPVSMAAPEPINASEPAPTTLEKKEIDKEIKKLSLKDREKIGGGFATIGFRVEKRKNEFFATVFNGIITGFEIKGAKFKGIGEKEGRGRFYKELRDSFVRDAKEAEKKAIEIRDGKDKAKLRNVGLLTGNILKYGRIVADVTGASIANPLRWTMMSAMAVARGAEAGKETRLKNEKVIEKTRIQDADVAAEEAWRIYENAYKESSRNGETVSAENLKDAYLKEIPEDLVKRLGTPETTIGFVQNFLKTLIGSSLWRLDQKIQKIGANTKLSQTEKEKEINKLIKKWEKDLTDYDRMVTQYETVDELAMAARYLQKAGKLAVLGMQIETAVVSVEKVFSKISELLVSHDIHPIDSAGKFIKGIFTKTEKEKTPPAWAQKAVHEIEEQNTQTQEPTSVNKTNTADTKPEQTSASEASPKPATKIPPDTAPSSTPQPTQTVPETIEIKPEAIIGHNEGIEHALKRQIAGDMEMAKALGYKEGMDLKKFSEGEAHGMAIRHGYVDRVTGEEIRVRGNAGEVAYRARLENGEVKIEEFKMKDGKFSPSDKIHEKSSPFEGDEKEDYEYRSRGGGKKVSIEKSPDAAASSEPVAVKAPVDTPPAPVETAAPVTTPAETHADTQAQVDAIRENINQKIEATNNKVTVGTTIQTGTTIGTGDIPTPGRGAGGYNINFRGNDFWPQGGGGEIMYHGYNIEGLPQRTANMLHNILETHPEFAGNPYELTPQELIEVYDANRDNIFKVFPNNPEDVWGMFKNTSAKDMLYTPEADAEKGLPSFIQYLKKLKNITGLEPKGKIVLVRSAETNEQYIARALQKVKALGKMGELKASLEK